MSGKNGKFFDKNLPFHQLFYYLKCDLIARPSKLSDRHAQLLAGNLGSQETLANHI